MDMRRLKTIALCFGLSTAMLVTQDVAPALATPTSSAEVVAKTRFWLRSQNLLGGKKAWSNYSTDVEDNVRTCSQTAACRANFGKGVGPADIENLRSFLDSLKGGSRE
jgi:hypothetical protein